MSKIYNNRERSDRYQGNRSYIHRPGTVEWWRGACALFAIFVSAWFVWHFGFSAEAREKGFHSSRGELAFKHAAWETKCDACHVPFDQITNQENKDFWSINARWKEFTCRHCHSAPPHHTYALSADVEFDKNCAACHHDHSGKEYSLVRISDNHCTRCHAELDKHPNKFVRNNNYNANITGFGMKNGHPEFSALTEEHRRTIKFSHALHMAPGIFVNNKPSRQEDVWSIEKIKEIEKIKNGDSKEKPMFSYVDRYAQFESTGKLTDANGKEISYTQLTCMACHELDSGRRSRFDVKDAAGNVVEDGWNGTDKIVPEAPRENLLPARAEGAYYLPVNFEKHCQACHPIAINLKTREGHDVRLDLPHRKQLNDFSDTLYDRVTRIFLINEGGASAKSDLPSRLDKPLFPVTTEGKEKLKEAFDDAKKKLFDPTKGKLNDSIRNTGERGDLAIKTSGTTCQKCHTVTQDQVSKELFVKPGNTPSVWFEHAKFSHVGHRAMKCAECHKNYAGDTSYDPSSGALRWEDPEQWDDPKSGIKQPKVDIAGVEECQKCHSPAREENGVQFGGVRHDCTDCHRYHNAEFPLQGMGAINRDPGFDPEHGKNATTPGLDPREDLRRDPSKRLDWKMLLDGIPPEQRKK